MMMILIMMIKDDGDGQYNETATGTTFESLKNKNYIHNCGSNKTIIHT